MSKLAKTMMLLFCVAMLASCEKQDCKCKYYTSENQPMEESWDGTGMTASQCQDMASSVNEEAATSVSCSLEWD